jgi:outer membrane lipoprotein SlyB
MTQQRTVEKETVTETPTTPNQTVETTRVVDGHRHGDEEAGGAVAGGAAGAVAGAVVGGPVGAVVGGAIGAAGGATAGLADEETKDDDVVVTQQEVTRR